MDPNDKLLKATAEAAGLDSSRAMLKLYIKIKKEIVRDLESKRQKLRLQVAEMRVTVMERRGELKLLDERIRHAEEYNESRQQYQAQLIRAIEAEKARRNMIKRNHEEVIDRLKKTWEGYLEVYNRFPLAQKKAALEKKAKLRKFQLKVATQSAKDMQQIYENMMHIKKLIRESREKKMTQVRATIERDQATLAKLLRIKQEKLELLNRLKAEKEAKEKEREKQQLCEIKSSGPSGSPFSWATPSTPGPLSQQSYGLGPTLSQISQIPWSQAQMLPCSSQSTVRMSFTRRIIEERCSVVVSPRPDSTTTTSSAPTAICSSKVQDARTVTGQGSTCDELMEVETVLETGRSIVDVEYGGSDSSQNSSMDMFAEDAPTAELSQRQETTSSQFVDVRPSGSAHLPQSIGTPSAPISYGNIQSQTTAALTVTSRSSSPLCTRSTSHTAPASAHTKPTDFEKTPEPVIVTSGFVTPTTEASPAYATPSFQMKSVSSASTTPRPALQNVASPASALRLTHQNFASPAAAPRPMHQNFASRALSSKQQQRTIAAPRLTHQNDVSAAAAPRPTHQNVASRAPTPIQQHVHFATPRPMHQNVASPAAAPCPTHQNVASRAPFLIQQQGIAAAPRLTHQNFASSAATPRPTHQNAASPAAAFLPTQHSAVSRSQAIVNKAAAPMRELHIGGTSQASSLTAPGSQNAAPGSQNAAPKSKPQFPHFHPYMSPKNASGNPVTHSVSQPAPNPSSFTQNPTIYDRRVSSQPARTAATVPAQLESTPPAKTQPNSVTQKSPSPALMATATQKTMVSTTQQATMNEISKPENFPSEGEKSHYFHRQERVSENQQGAISDPEKECHENLDQAQANDASSEYNCRTSECAYELNPQESDDFDMGDELTSPPFSKDDEDISPPRLFKSPPSDLGSDETANAVGGENFARLSSLFGNPFGAPSNTAASGDASGQANIATPFSFAAAPLSNIFKLF